MSATSISPAAEEAFKYLNAGARKHWRGQGDTWTAARDRAAREAGVTPAQAERLQKNWKSMKFPNGDVYRLLRNKYEALCERVEIAAGRMESELREIEGGDAIGKGHPQMGGSMAGASRGSSEQEMR